MELIPMMLKSSEDQPSRTYKSNLAQTWHPMLLFQFLSRTYKIFSKCYIDEEIQFLINVITGKGYERKFLENISKNYLNKLQNPPATNKDNSESIN